MKKNSYMLVVMPLVYIHKSYKLQSSYFEFKIYIFSLLLDDDMRARWQTQREEKMNFYVINV
jgi:hypothetical protein